MKTLLYLILSIMSVAMYGQKIPVMQKKIVGNEHRIDVYTATQNKANVLNVSQIAEDIEFLPLETTDECLLGDGIRNLVVSQSDIIIFDGEEVCYRFGRNGKFKNRIGRKGNGPGEYVKSFYVVVDTLNQWVYMGDYNQKKFVKYDYEGKFLANLKTDGVGLLNYLYKPMQLVMVNNFYQYAKKGQRFSLNLYDEKSKKIISRMSCDYREDIPQLAICNPSVYNYKGNTYVKDYWCDTIYRMKDPYHLESVAYVDKGKYVERTENDYSLIGKKANPRDYMVLSILEINETDRYIILTTSKGRVYYDKKEKKTFATGTLRQPTFLTAKDDLYGGPGLQDFHINDNTLYTFRYPHEFEEYSNGKHSITDARYNAYRKMVEELNSEDNPVIMIVKLKK